MKKSLLIAAVALALVLLPGSAAFADSWTGRISDDHCGAGGAKDGHAACAKKCVGGGGKYVFVNGADKKVYQISKQDLSDDLLSGASRYANALAALGVEPGDRPGEGGLEVDVVALEPALGGEGEDHGVRGVAAAGSRRRGSSPRSRWPRA